MAQLPLINIPQPQTMDMESKWKSILDPVLANVLLQGTLVKASLVSSPSNVINHLLGRMQIGWILADVDSNATIYRSQPFNSQTLVLNSNGTANVLIWCF